jgi:hypothetical protein
MKKSSRFQGFLFLAGFAFFLLAFPLISFADTDIKSKISLIQSPLLADRATGTSYFDVSLKNISPDILLTPIKVVIDSVTPAGVTVKNADGITSDGKPYYNYNLAAGVIVSNQITGGKKWVFSNSSRLRFNYIFSVRGNIPEAASTIGPEGGSISVTNPISALYGTKVEIPKNALPPSEVGTILTIQGNSSGVQLLQEGYELLTPGVRITSSIPLKRYVMVTLPVKGKILKDDMIVVSHYDETANTWSTLPVGFIDTQENVLKFVTPGFSIFEGIKYKGLPPSDQLNMDIFMRIQYPMLLSKISNAENTSKIMSDYEAYKTRVVDQGIAATKATLTAMTLPFSSCNAEYALALADSIIPTINLVYTAPGDSSKDWIDPMVDMTKCVFEGTVNAICSGLLIEVEVAKACSLDTIKNVVDGTIRFYTALEIFNETKIVNETNIAIDYLQLFYSTSGNLPLMANYAQAKDVTEDAILKAIGEAYYKKGWFAWDDYNLDRVKQTILDLKNDVQRARQFYDADNC